LKNIIKTTVMTEKIRVLYSRDHQTIFPRLGVFLAGPTPPEEDILIGWRRILIKALQDNHELDPSMIVVAPEPENGIWKDIDLVEDTVLAKVQNRQVPWEWQYLGLCDITAFWLPTYWDKETGGNFAGNIGPTSRFEFGYYLQEYLKNPLRRRFIVGAPEDAESVRWAKRIAEVHGIKWHTLKTAEKEKQVADSFIEEIANTLIQGKWSY
jgi:hypothetical protein